MKRAGIIATAALGLAGIIGTIGCGCNSERIVYDRLVEKMEQNRIAVSPKGFWTQESMSNEKESYHAVVRMVRFHNGIEEAYEPSPNLEVAIIQRGKRCGLKRVKNMATQEVLVFQETEKDPTAELYPLFACRIAPGETPRRPTPEEESRFYDALGQLAARYAASR